jgi:hypothetical protein
LATSLGIGIWGVGGGAGSGAAGRFDGPVVINGDLTVNGVTHAPVKLADGSHRSLHGVESPERWCEDFGGGQLTGGVAHVAIDPHFAEITVPGAYHVFVQGYDGDHGLHVTNRTKSGFEVRARSTAASSDFSYRIVAKRKGHETGRFRKVALPEPLPPLPDDDAHDGTG